MKGRVLKLKRINIILRVRTNLICKKSCISMKQKLVFSAKR